MGLYMYVARRAHTQARHAHTSQAHKSTRVKAEEMKTWEAKVVQCVDMMYTGTHVSHRRTTAGWLEVT